MNTTVHSLTRGRGNVAAAAGALWMVIASVALAAPADISNTPMAQAANGDVRSNIMFILDDSGSMGSTAVPDDVNDYNNLCEGYHGVNGIFYNPAAVYRPPIRADGTSYTDASFTSAWSDGYAQSGNVNLNQVANLGDATLSRTDYRGVPVTRVGGTNSNPTNSRFYYATYKTTVNPSTPVCTGVQYDWTKWDIVTSAAGWTPAERTNYANWYSYYRTRMLAMRAGVGRAFSGLAADRVRVGYSTISETGVTNNSKFLNVGDFDAGTQKADFYTKLYAAIPSGGTPLRPALVKAGKYFANKISGQTDPMQYSCQKNFTILSTDGYWNTGSGEPASYVPTRLNGTTAIGNPDGGSTIARPMRDACTPGNGANGCTNSASGTGVNNSLADIAMYFYSTDLRDQATLNNCTGAISGENVCTDKPADNSNSIKFQNMTTYTVGLGVNGLLNYRSDYKTSTSGDYFDIKQGTKVWPNPKSDDAIGGLADAGWNVVTRIDDLWHAAVNGGGTYFSANDALQLSSNLQQAFVDINSKTAAGSASSTSSLRPTAGDDWLFFSLATTGKWTGQLRAYKIDVSTGAVLNPSTPIWEASARIDAQGARTIYHYKPSATNKIAPFTYANLTTGQQAYFDNLCLTGSEKLSQCPLLSAPARAQVTGANVVNYLTGTRTKEMTAALVDNRLFRARDTVLGDIVNASAVYVKKSPFVYGDFGHNTFATSTATRTGVIYTAANDGMLHAIKVGTSVTDPTGGTELWAYVPSMVMPKMWKLADDRYSNMHEYYVDATPVIGDVYDSATSSWKTILVGGLNAGGRGYYALDITVPESPKVLWEASSATDSDIGLTFGNPIITKNKAGVWVVAFSSGYNNVSPGSGNGHLFVVNALTGSLNGAGTAFNTADVSFRKLPTNVIAIPVGSSVTPSNLGKINAWIDSDAGNTTKRFYGGDMLGNVWRFDFDDNIAPLGNEAFRIGYTASNQPITTKPQLTEVKVGASAVPVVTIATGRLLGASDVADNSTQSVYAIKDDLSVIPLGDLRSGGSGLVRQNLGTDRRLSPVNAVDWSTSKGWYVDLDVTAGERVNIDFQQQFNLLTVASNIPAPTACTPGGTSWLYYFDIRSGTVLLTYYADSLTVGISTVALTTGKTVTYQQGSVDAPPTVRGDPPPPGAGASTLRRTSWRELVD